MRRHVPWSTWIVGWLAAIVFAGGVAEVFAESRDPEVETIVRDVHVLPEGQAQVRGTLVTLRGTDVNGPPLPLPLQLPAGGRARIETGTETAVWDGGRPFVLLGDGAIDLGPTDVTLDAAGVRWSLGGVRVLAPGAYTLRTPVAVGRGGLARPQDRFDFTAGDDATIDAPGAAVTRPLDRPLRLEGPGTLVLEGELHVRTRDGRRTVGRLAFGPGAFVVEVAPDRTFTATLQGPLREG